MFLATQSSAAFDNSVVAGYAGQECRDGRCSMDDLSTRTLSAMPSELLQVYDSLWQEVANLHSRWKIFSQLFAVSEERVDLLREMAPSFFGVLHDTFRDDILMALSRITDPSRTGKKENLSLVLLVERIDASKYPEIRKEADILVAAILTHCAPFRDLRNRNLAHKDLPSVLRYHTNPLPGISRDMIEHALRTIRSLMNSIQRYFDQAETAYEHIIQRGDGEDIVFYLEQAKEYQIHLYQTETRKHQPNSE